MRKNTRSMIISEEAILVDKLLFITLSAIKRKTFLANEALSDIFDRMRCEDFQYN